MKMIKILLLLSLAFFGIANATAPPSAPITLCTDKNGSFNYAICIVTPGNAAEVGDSFQITAWSEMRTNGVWNRTIGSISIRQASAAGGAYSTIASGQSVFQTTYVFQTPGFFTIYAHDSFAGDSPQISINVSRHIPIYSFSITPTTAVVGGSVQLVSDVDLYSPIGNLAFFVRAPSGTLTQFALQPINYSGSHVIFHDVRTFAFTGAYSTPGQYTFAISYQGDASNANGASSSDVIVQVGPFTTTTALTAPSDTSLTSQPITLTATVTGTNPGHTTPTGLVSFYDGANLLGSVSLSSTGVATLTTTQITITGSHSITATYGGDALNQPSTSVVVTHQTNFNPAILVPIISMLLGT